MTLYVPLGIIVAFLLLSGTSFLRLRKAIRRARQTQYSPPKGTECLKTLAPSILMSWVTSSALLIWALITGVPLASLGLKEPQELTNTLPLWEAVVVIGVAAVVAVVYTVFLWQLATSMKRRNETWQSIMGESAEDTAQSATMGTIVPRTAIDRCAGVLLACTAGICEEFIMRGVMLYLLTALIPGLHIQVAVVVAAVLFGLPHTNQGIQGMLAAAVLGLMLGFIYVATGSLLISIALHILIDIKIVFMYPWSFGTSSLVRPDELPCTVFAEGLGDFGRIDLAQFGYEDILLTEGSVAYGRTITLPDHRFILVFSVPSAIPDPELRRMFDSIGALRGREDLRAMRRNRDVLAVMADKLIPPARKWARNFSQVYAKLLPFAVSQAVSAYPYLAPALETGEYGPFLPLTKDEIALRLKPRILIFEPDEVSILYQIIGVQGPPKMFTLSLGIEVDGTVIRR